MDLKNEILSRETTFTFSKCSVACISETKDLREDAKGEKGDI